MRVLSRFSIIALCCIALQTSIYKPLLAQRSETALIGSVEVRPDSLDFKKFPPPKDVVLWGIGLYGAYKGTINTTFRSINPSYTPTVTLGGDNGVAVDLRGQLDYGITLYAPSIFTETLGFNLDIGVATYDFGTQLFPRFILSDTARDSYLRNVVDTSPLSKDANGQISPTRRAQAEVARFYTNVQVLNVAPMLNVGGLLLGANIGIPMPFLSSTIETQDGTALGFAKSTETISPDSLQIFVEPRIGLQVPLFKIRGVGGLFLNAQASYALGSSPLKLGALNSMNMKVESKLRELGWRDDNSYRYPVIAATSGINAGRTRFESINFQPLSVSAGLSFIISVGNNKDQVDEILNEERRSDSLRLVNSNVTHRMDSLRQRSIGLADKAITTIIQSSKISDRIAELEKQQLEKQKTALKTELSDTKKKVFQALFSAVTGTNDDGTETAENPTLRIEQFQAKTTKSLLPKIFFDQGSALLSTRYKRIQAAERESYKLPQDPFQSAYALYPNILNIVGKRLQTSSAKLTLTGFQTNDETDAKLAEKRVESVATYLQDIWKIPASRITRTVSKGTGTSADERRVEITSESADITAPLAIDYTTRLANPPILNIGLDISTGAGLKQWELEIQQVVNNQGVVLKDTTGGANFPPRFVWRLNEEPATMPQSSEPLSMRIGAYDINNAAAPDAPLKTIKVEQITLEQKRANKTKDKTVQQFEVLFGTNLTELDASSRRALDAAKAAITPQSKVLVTVFGGNASVSAKGVAQALSIDARSAVLRDAGNVPHSSSLPEAAAYNRIIRIRVETPTGM